MHKSNTIIITLINKKPLTHNRAHFFLNFMKGLVILTLGPNKHLMTSFSF